MRKRGLKRSFWANSGQYILPVAMFALVLGLFLVGVQTTAGSQKEEGLRVARESIVRGVLSCYAVEGSYPESYEYLKQNYGVKIDESKYMVDYMIFASNIMPDVSVLER